MNKLRVGIIEDEIPAARLLEQKIHKLRPLWEIKKIGGSVRESVEWFANNEHPDLLFLDIQLSDDNSFHFIEEADPESLIIFTTAYDDYAIKAFNVNSIDYLLKPIREDRLLAAIEKYERISDPQQAKINEQNILQEVLSNLSTEKKYRSRFLISLGGEKLSTLQASDVAYFYSVNKVTVAITKNNEEHVIEQTLEKLEEQLHPDQFFRANRQIIVNVDAIVKIEPYFLGKIVVQVSPQCKDKIVVSKGKARSFKLWLNY